MNRKPELVANPVSLSRRVLLQVVGGAAIAVGGGAAPFMASNATAAFQAAPMAGGSALADRLAWFLATVNSGGKHLTAADIVDNISPDMLEAIPPDQIIGLMQSLAAGFGKLTLQGTTRPQTADQAVSLIATEVGMQIALPIRIESDAPRRIAGITLYPVPGADGLPLQPNETDIRSAKPVGLVEIGERGLYGSQIGADGPTVVFEAGLTDSAATWTGILPAIAAKTRVFTYDRANTTAGASDAVAGPRTASDVVEDLHALLHIANVPGPYILVGHSVGGIFSRLYASTYPDEVVGMVLVDSSHEDQDIRRETLVSPALFALEQQYLQINASEGIDLAASFSEVRTARSAASLKPMPLVVLTAGVAEPDRFPEGWPMDVEESLHLELQEDLAHLVSNGRLVVAEKSGHYIHQTQPDLVAAAILDVVQAVVDPSTWD